MAMFGGPRWRAGWAPYSCGNWVWEDWYGWTWVGCESWGWAPYHYGRWFNDPAYGGWLWYPGALGVRHYWSPALVGFFGWGGGVGFGFGFGNIGWVALAPFEMFHPWWGSGFYGAGFAGRVNITNVNVYNTFRNARVANGVSGVTAANFRGGQFGGNIMHASGEQLRSAGMVRGQMPIGPSSANMRFSDRAAGFTPRAGGATSFFTHQQPGAVQHMAVTQGLRSSGQSAVENRTGGGAPSGAGRTGAPAAARPEQNGASGWSRFGTPSGQAAGAPRQEGAAGRSSQSPGVQNTRPSQAPGNNGWRGFGEPSNGGHPSVGAGGRSQTAPAGGQGGQGGQRYNIAPQVMHERQSAPSSSAPRSAPSYSAPKSAPSYSAPRPSGGGGAATHRAADIRAAMEDITARASFLQARESISSSHWPGPIQRGPGRFFAGFSLLLWRSCGRVFQDRSLTVAAPIRAARVCKRYFDTWPLPPFSTESMNASTFALHREFAGPQLLSQPNGDGRAIIRPCMQASPDVVAPNRLG